jgi:hypothetical protein
MLIILISVTRPNDLQQLLYGVLILLSRSPGGRAVEAFVDGCRTARSGATGSRGLES